VKLLEHRGKGLLLRHGIPVPRGFVVRSPEELTDLPWPAAIKAQVFAGGRGKAGGIRFAESLEDAKKAVDAVLKLEIGGHAVREVLVEERLPIQQELYLGLVIDRSARAPLLMASLEGGIEIEAVAEEAIFRMHLPPLLALQPYQVRRLLGFLKLTGATGRSVGEIAQKLAKLFVAEDAELAEINPLVITKDRMVVAGDAKLTLDSDALYRHPDCADLSEDLTALEDRARRKDIAFVQLEGDIGVIANGAGLTMATLDLIGRHGGSAGTFLDLGGTDDLEKVKEAFRIIRVTKPRVVLLNIFGGITKCDTVAAGIRDVLEEHPLEVPLVARMQGLHEERGREILHTIGVETAASADEAAKRAVGLRNSQG